MTKTQKLLIIIPICSLIGLFVYLTKDIGNRMDNQIYENRIIVEDCSLGEDTKRDVQYLINSTTIITIPFDKITSLTLIINGGSFELKRTM